MNCHADALLAIHAHLRRAVSRKDQTAIADVCNAAGSLETIRAAEVLAVSPGVAFSALIEGWPLERIKLELERERWKTER